MINQFKIGDVLVRNNRRAHKFSDYNNPCVSKIIITKVNDTLWKARVMNIDGGNWYISLRDVAYYWTKA